MATRMVATVFGGSGFLGRYVVQRLARRGFVVRVAVRDPVAAGFLKPMGAVGQIVPLYTPVTDEALVHRALEGASWAVNLIGILAERHAGDFDRVHAEGAGRVARLAAACGVRALVQVSAIGADPTSPSRYGRSKAAGEAAVLAAFPAATILRPSLVFGPEDAFFNRFAGLARLLPVMPVIAGATRFQPVYAGDVADAALAALDRHAAAGMLYELGGPEVRSFRELMAAVLTWTGRHRPLVNVPMGLARLQARLGELVPGKPLTRDQLLMLGRDNVVAPGTPGLAELGIVPTPMELIVPDYLARFRPGGGRRVWPEGRVERSGPDLSSPVTRVA
jgi:uncharacterized protein YbjT (DUF2867 family)